MREFAGSSNFLKVADRCDRCGAQAFALALVNDVRLLFCGHHFRKHREALAEVASVLVDETYKLEDQTCTL